MEPTRPTDLCDSVTAARGSFATLDGKDMDMSDTNDNRQSSLMRFFGRPEVGIAGSIASIIGIGLSVYFFLASREVSELTYFVHPAKAAVVRTGQTSRVSVQFDGQILTGDIRAAQVAFWNAGRRPIRGDAILSPLVIRTRNKERILEARLRKTSRDVVGAVVDSARLPSGEVEIRWNILEHNDGGVLQIVYIGNEAVEIEARGVLEGQPELVRLDYARATSTPDEEYSRRQGWQARWPSYGMVGAACLVTAGSLFIFPWRRRRELRPSDWFNLFSGPLMLVISIWILVATRVPGPPFGF